MYEYKNTAFVLPFLSIYDIDFIKLKLKHILNKV